MVKGTYGYDVSFLKQHTNDALELYSDDSASAILLSPTWQGRVMTSTANGYSGKSFGWINYGLLSSKEKRTQFNPVGGEERFWIGPEGGQYSFYFQKDDSFSIEHWQVPAIIDAVAYKVVRSNQSEAVFSATAKLTNYSGSIFEMNIERTVKLLSDDEIGKQLGMGIDKNINSVAYKTINSITNAGTNDWTKNNGLPSIWLLGMFTPSPQTVVIIPFQNISNAKSFITDNYFGSVPQDRLTIKDSVLYFTCDGKYRSKIGLSPLIAKPIAAGYDFAGNVLTLVLPEIHKDKSYVNSKWELQKEPYTGDVINSYNDGPLADGSQMGPFYEIESSSPALELEKGATGSYTQTTCHLQGTYSAMKKIVKELLAVDLDELKK